MTGARPKTGAQPATGRRLGVRLCLRCRAATRVPAAAAAAARLLCPRCHAPLHERRPGSRSVCAALLLTAAILYVPANLLPVMHTRTLFGEDDDTILSGVIALLHAGSWPLALLVFFASIVVPLLKLVSLGWLLLSTLGAPAPAAPRSRLYRMVEFVGRWSMLDVFAVTVLACLVQFRTLANVRVGTGALAFCAVVVLTMLAAQTFDERLLWDSDAAA